MIELLAACGILLASGLAAAVTARSSPRVAAALGCAGAPLAAFLGAAPVTRVLAGGVIPRLEVSWSLPGPALSFGLDPLSAFFLVPVLGLSALAAIYGRAYLSADANPRRAARSWLFFNGLCAAMVVVTLARSAIPFLVAWETMSLCAYVLVSLEHERAESRRAGWVYLIASHAGTAALLALFVLLGDSLAGERGASLVQAGATAPVLLGLALFGFGVKAGIVPLHVWLPGAHAAAPSHVSALMSGAMVKLGWYGLLRVVWLLGGAPVEFGVSLAALGLAGALLGISLSLTQRDLKRALAHSSVENLGLVGFGLGIGLTGLARGGETLALFGLTAGLFHVWNHAAMKGLLFFAAGAVQHGADTRDLERLGGLSRAMPRAALLFCIGAVALSALPPLSGFATEWLLYLGLVDAVTRESPLGFVGASLALGSLALVGALGAAGFVRLFGVVFLGRARSDAASHAHDVGGSMLGAAAVLAALCLAIGLLPGVAVRAVAAPLQDLLGTELGGLGAAPAVAALAPLTPLAVALWLAIGGVAALLVARVRRRKLAREDTWGCGYAAATPRTQYTARAFAELFTSGVLPRALAPVTEEPSPRGVTPAAAALRAEYSEPILARIYQPIFSAAADAFTRPRFLQQGSAHVYVGYIMVAIVAALAWASLRGTFSR
jgi:formate hydrogenlyase subunit 3/multisubunit Na+/H+ antiporter MnhD subunit